MVYHTYAEMVEFIEGRIMFEAKWLKNMQRKAELRGYDFKALHPSTYWYHKGTIDTLYEILQRMTPDHLKAYASLDGGSEHERRDT